MSLKHLSFIDLFSKEDLTVEIPMLQRDYAYGRITESEKRKEFLKSIKGYLASDNRNHELDFVYGSVSEPKGKKKSNSFRWTTENHDLIFASLVFCYCK